MNIIYDVTSNFCFRCSRCLLDCLKISWLNAFFAYRKCLVDCYLDVIVLYILGLKYVLYKKKSGLVNLTYNTTKTTIKQVNVYFLLIFLSLIQVIVYFF